MSVSVDPNFKSTLPPRKRAKTQEEKEQRRMERILRNRRAAHASREKKRRHVEHLEAYVLALEKNLLLMSENVSKLSVDASESVLSTLEQPQDLSQMKAATNTLSICLAPIPSNSISDGDLSTYEDHELVSVKLEPQSPLFMAKKSIPPYLSTDDEILVDHSNGYYNYLSPVSLQSPVDLTLKQEPHSSVPSSPLSFNYSSIDHQHSIVTLPTSGPDILAQNSEVILFPRAIIV